MSSDNKANNRGVDNDDSDTKLQKILNETTDWRKLILLVPRDCITCDGPDCNKSNPPFRCSRCHLQWYCSRDCQRKHWQVQHKIRCFCPEKPTLIEEEVFEDKDLLHYPTMLLGQDASRQLDLDWTMQGSLGHNSVCQICLKDNNTDLVGEQYNNMVVLPCRHPFCASCIIEWQKGNHTKRDNLFRGDSCPTCRESIPIVEKCLTERAEQLRAKAIKMQDKQIKSDLLQEAMVAVNKVLSYSGCQRYAFMQKAEIEMDMDKPLDAVKTIDEFMEFHYNTTQHPVARACGRYEAAKAAGDEAEARIVKQDMEALARKFLPDYTNPFFLILKAYALQAKAYMQAEEWQEAFVLYGEKIYGFAWELLIKYARHKASQQMNFEYMYGIARCMYELGDYENAMNTFEEATSISRILPEKQYEYLALSLYKMGHLDLAVRAMNRAVLHQNSDDKQLERNCKLYQKLLREQLEAYGHTNNS